ncbi:MAG: glycyl radical protein [Firmicutes bacterium]|nr:glycyl radical protein [Bacillota bacterium]
MNDRVRDLKQRVIPKSSVGMKYAENVFLDVDRGRLWTESYRQTDGEPEVIRRAKALKNLLEKLSIWIKEGELIVGAGTNHPRAILGTFELSDTAIEHVVEDGFVREEDKADLKEIMAYWKPRNMWSRVRELGNLDEAHLYNAGNAVMAGALTARDGFGSSQPDYEFVFRNGLNALIKRMEQKIEEARKGGYTDDVFDLARKVTQWKAMIIAAQAAIDWSRRYAALARFLASEEEDPVRKAELERVADVCDRCLAEPVQTFHEAVQAVWFIQVLTHQLERFALGTSVRIDQILYPYYQADIDAGRITRDQALEMLECLWLKLLETGYAQTREARRRLQGSGMLQIYTLGGVKKDGSDACNEVTKLCLEATRDTRSVQPSFGFRVHSKTPDEYLRAAFEVVKTGMAIPSFENDEVAITSLMSNFGCTLEQARDWALILCKSPGPVGPYGTPRRRPWSSNAAGILTVVLNDGVEPVSGIRMGPPTNPHTWKSIDDVYEAFRKQYAIALQMGQRMRNLAAAVERQYLQQPFLSCCLEPFLEKGVDVMEHDELPVPWFNVNGLIDAADSMAAMDKLIFREKKHTIEQLLDALKNNWEGYEEMRQDFMRAPSFGNDDDFADAHARRCLDIIVEEGLKVKDAWGASPRPLPQSVTEFRGLGAITGPTPNGRKKGEVLADGGTSPRYGRDKKGPTAVLKSCSKLDAVKCRAILLNQRLSPASLQGEKGWQLFRAYIKTWHDLLVQHVQINVVDTETLKAAQREPEKFPDLVVRVAGYSAYFTQLDKETQDSIIARTEHSLAAS